LKKNRIKMLPAVLVLILAAGLWYWNSDDRKDRAVWKEFRDRLTADQVKGIELNMHERGQAVELSESEQAMMLELLKQAAFESSNRIGHGATASGIMLLTFTEGYEVPVRIYGGQERVSNRFELSPERIDEESQFYVTSEELADFLEQKLERKE
jgi:hypothetical protein